MGRRAAIATAIATAAIAAAIVGTAFGVQSMSYFEPACPRLVYTADGNVQPLFCSIDNPAALAFYRGLAPHLMALGATASPSDVERALELDSKRTTLPELCSAYALMEHRWRWNFGVTPITNC